MIDKIDLTIINNNHDHSDKADIITKFVSTKINNNH